MLLSSSISLNSIQSRLWPQGKFLICCSTMIAICGHVFHSRCMRSFRRRQTLLRHRRPTVKLKIPFSYNHTLMPHPRSPIFAIKQRARIELMSFMIKFLLMNVDILFSDTTLAMVVNLAVEPPFEHNTGELDTPVIKLEQIYRAGVAWCDGQSQLPQNGAAKILNLWRSLCCRNRTSTRTLTRSHTSLPPHGRSAGVTGGPGLRDGENAPGPPRGRRSGQVVFNSGKARFFRRTQVRCVICDHPHLQRVPASAMIGGNTLQTRLVSIARITGSGSGRVTRTCSPAFRRVDGADGSPPQPRHGQYSGCQPGGALPALSHAAQSR